MTIGEDFRAYLLSKAAIQALIGGAAGRVYVGKAPQGAAFPRLTIHLTDGDGVHGMAGALGHWRPRVQVSAWAESEPASGALANEVRKACDGFNGTMGATRVRSCFLERRTQLHEPPTRGDDGGVWHVALDFRLACAESVPTL